jgi:hypothetical protein|tara:strand:- start:5998 stop:6246 length:249 start_codon:yes stop_codon:yes gene_type:complete
MDTIHSLKLGLTLGILIGVSFFFLSFIVNKKYGVVFFNMLKNVYPGCSNKTLGNKLMCGLLGFLDGFVGGYLIGVIYNHIPL